MGGKKCRLHLAGRVISEKVRKSGVRYEKKRLKKECASRKAKRAGPDDRRVSLQGGLCDVFIYIYNTRRCLIRDFIRSLDDILFLCRLDRNASSRVIKCLTRRKLAEVVRNTIMSH